MNRGITKLEIMIILLILAGLAAVAGVAIRGYEPLIEEPSADYITGYNEGYNDCIQKLYATYLLPFTEDQKATGEEILTIEECIRSSRHAADNHAQHAFYLGENVEHNIYWMNLHNSCAYWLEYYLGGGE